MNEFYIYTLLCSLISLLLAAAYVTLLRKVSALSSVKRDFAKLAIYSTFLFLIGGLTYLLDTKFPTANEPSYRILEALPFIVGYGYLFYRIKTIRNFDL